MFRRPPFGGGGLTLSRKKVNFVLVEFLQFRFESGCLGFGAAGFFVFEN
jgi:hypothetical protein